LESLNLFWNLSNPWYWYLLVTLMTSMNTLMPSQLRPEHQPLPALGTAVLIIPSCPGHNSCMLLHGMLAQLAMLAKCR
jgi:hypothetical protein